MVGINRLAVIDSSFVLSFLLLDETKNNEVEEVFDYLIMGKIKLFAPVLLPFEIFNGLNQAARRKRIKFNMAKQLGGEFLKLEISLV